jgi:hypothetical protein
MSDTTINHAESNGHGGNGSAMAFLMAADPPAAPRGAYARGAQVYADQSWSGMIPLDPKTKVVIPQGVTGREGRQTRPEVYAGAAALKRYGRANIGWRVPLGVIGLDVDHGYGEKVKKAGGDTLASLVKPDQLGPLPQTWSSTARGADQPSRIMFFRVPQDCGELVPYAGRDIDVIQHHHRYAAVWPSVHGKTGTGYQWYRPDGSVASGPPSGPEAFAELPPAWLEHLSKIQRDDVGAGYGVDDFADQCTGSTDPSITEYVRGAFRSQPGSRHDSMLIALGWAARAAADWKVPAREVFDLLRADWDEATDGESREQEFEDLLSTAVADAPEPRNPEEAGAVEDMMKLIMTRARLRDIPPPRYLIKGWLTAGTGNRINGDPGSGKSLVALDWAACIGTGTEWNGCEVQKGTVVYVVAEGLEGFAAKRVPAWEQHYGKEMDGVLIYPKPIQILSKSFGELGASPEWGTFRAVMRKIKPDLVIFDTQRRVMTAAGENDNNDLQKAINLLDYELDSAWLLVHHTPKNSTGGAGGGAVWGAVNTEFGMSKKGRGLEGSTFTLKNTKEKDGEDGEEITFRLQRYDVTPDDPSIDPFEDQVTSVVLVPHGDADERSAIHEVDLSIPNGTTARDALALLLRRVWRDQVFTKAQAWSTVNDAGAMARQTFYNNFGRLKRDDVIMAVLSSTGAETEKFTIAPEQDQEEDLES